METEVQMQGFINDRSRIAKARRIVYGYVKSQDDTALDFSIEDVLVVWFCKTLQNWKAILTVASPYAVIYEVSYNGDKEEAYLDVYSKIDNVVFKDK